EADAALVDVCRRHFGVAFALDAPFEAPVSGDSAGLRVALDNLLENAARYGVCTVRVRVEFGRFVVDDDGPGILPDDRERVFARFVCGRRATAAGSGFGLAIVAQQVDLHGGRVYAEDFLFGDA